MSYPLFSRGQDRLSRLFAILLALGGAQVVWFGVAGFLAGGRFALGEDERWDEVIPLEALALPWFVTVAIGVAIAVVAVCLLLDRRTPRPAGFLIQCLLIVVLLSIWFVLLAAVYPQSADPLVLGWHWLAAPAQAVTILALAFTLPRELRRERAERERLEREQAALLAAAQPRARRRWGRR